jgi:excisionase family DNA binding protein
MKPPTIFRNPQQSSDRALWSTPELANYLGCSDRQVYNLRKSGLPFVLVGGLVRFDAQQVQAWLKVQKPHGTEDAKRIAQLTEIANHGDEDNRQCAAADLAKEFPTHA